MDDISHIEIYNKLRNLSAKLIAEIPETMAGFGVAILMGGGPSMVYGCEALEALDQFEAE